MAKTWASILAAGLLALAAPAAAQSDGECGTGFCGTSPKRPAGPATLDNSDLGISYSPVGDFDGDGYDDEFDNCPLLPNRGQADGDVDGHGDGCDNCPANANVDQADNDGDGLGDLCDPDADNDGVPNATDNCAFVPNKAQTDTDRDGLGDACDPDIDGDGVPNRDDPCIFAANVTTGCAGDADRDGIEDAMDNCPLAANPSQADKDKDGLGDNCDSDADGDGVPNGNDNCSLVANRDQSDADHDGVGDVCDPVLCVVPPKNPDPAQCLDPMAAFKVVAAPRVVVGSGERVLLAVYANRVGATLSYQWSVASGPSGTAETVRNPIGAARCSGGYECVPGLEPAFTACLAGEYSLALSADLQAPDPIVPAATHAESTVLITVVGGDKVGVDGGCELAGSGGGGSGGTGGSGAVGSGGASTNTRVTGAGGASTSTSTSGTATGGAMGGATAGSTGWPAAGGVGGATSPRPGKSSSGCSCATATVRLSAPLLPLLLGLVVTFFAARRRTPASSPRRR